MSIRESSFNKKLREELGARGFKIDRIESHATAPGIPDDAFVHKPTGLTGWIEVKEAAIIPVKVKYRPKQAQWLETHVRCNGNAMTIIHIKSSKTVVIVPGECSYAAEKDLRSLLAKNPEGCYTIPTFNGWDIIAAAIIENCKTIVVC